VQELIAWYDRETGITDNDPVGAWPWAFGRFSDGTPIEASHRWLYREHRDLQLAFPDPYDAGRGRPTFLSWCESEGRLRYPRFFPSSGSPLAASPPPVRTTVTIGTAIQLSLLMASPQRGRALRARLRGMLKREGMRGLTRRLGALRSRRQP
jgi:hypothetical protein